MFRGQHPIARPSRRRGKTAPWRLGVFGALLALLFTLPIQGATPDRRPDHALDVLRKAGMFRTFLKGAGDEQIQGFLSTGTSLTIFVPRDEAFAALDEETRQALTLPENKELLKRLVRSHIVENEFHGSFEGRAELVSLAGEPVAYRKRGERITLNGNVRVIKADIGASNGIIHVIDKVILPPDFKVALIKPTPEPENSDKQS
ncbi:MAG: fasciclin domain-containing protein [Verrucomicrobiota bacterium]